MYKTQVETKKYGGTHVAVNVRIDLKKHYPKHKFQVTSDIRSVNIKCDPDIRKDVQDLLSKWKNERFDMMQDCSETINTNLTKEFGGCRFIFVEKFNHGY